MNRVYLDWNATAPLRQEARGAMLAAMDVVGNPSSVHAEGRAAKAIVEKARGQVAALVGCAPGDVVFTSGATEAAHAVFNLPFNKIWDSALEHDAVLGALLQANGMERSSLEVSATTIGAPNLDGLADPFEWAKHASPKLHVVSAANAETGVLSDWRKVRRISSDLESAWFCDATQAIGKTCFSVSEVGADYAICSAHKIGGPKGAGALIARAQIDPFHVFIKGGGQEMGRRSGTENVTGIAGFGAAAEAAQHDLEHCAWDRVRRLRDDLEQALAAAAPDLHVFGQEAPRLPNTSCFAVRGWKGETQVMQMDLAGFAVSAGSACSSGKVNKASRVLKAMGHDEEMASSAIRVSIGPTTTEAEVMAFADTWIEHYRRRRARAA